MTAQTTHAERRIMVADDEPAILDLLRRSLQKEGFATDCVEDGEMALESIKQTLPDLAILDLMMPKLTGLEVCRVLRAQPRTAQVPLIMISACTDEVDRIVAFEVGFDDYVTKPFSPRELMLRIKAILRTSPAAPSPNGLVEVGEISMNEQAHAVYVAGSEVMVTAIEYRLLRLFLHAPNRVHSREELLKKVWGAEKIELRTIDTQVRRLRASLGEAAEQIETVRAFGYRLTASPRLA